MQRSTKSSTKSGKQGSAGGKAAALARRRRLAATLELFGVTPTCAWELSRELGRPAILVEAAELERLGHLLRMPPPGNCTYVRCSKWERSDGKGPVLAVLYGGKSAPPPAAAALGLEDA